MAITKISLKVMFLVSILGSLNHAVNAVTPVRKCNNGQPLPLAVQIDDCLMSTCNLIKGTDSHIGIQFVSKRNSVAQLQAEVRLKTIGTPVPYDLPAKNSDVCSNLLYGAYCPLDASEDVTYHLVLPVYPHLPEVPTKLEVSIVDHETNEVVACFVADTHVKSGKVVLN